MEQNCYFRVPYEDTTNQHNGVQWTKFGGQQSLQSVEQLWVFRNLDACFKEPFPKSLPSL